MMVSLHVLVHCPCHLLCYRVPKHTASIVDRIRDNTRKSESPGLPDFPGYAEYPHFPESLAVLAGLEEHSAKRKEIVRNVTTKRTQFVMKK